jgi:hypothetical protein
MPSKVFLNNKIEFRRYFVQSPGSDCLQVGYIALSFRGFLGLGDKHFSFLWKAIHDSEKFNSFVLNLAKDNLQADPQGDNV